MDVLSMPWQDLYARLASRWEQGQFVTIIAPTGRGKTVLIQELTALRDSVVFFGTKVKDPEYSRMLRSGNWYRSSRWPPLSRWEKKVLLWPRPEPTIAESLNVQRTLFTRTLDQLYRKGKWTVVIDELHWMTHQLQLGTQIAALHHQGRSSGLTLIDGYQRPAFVPRVVHSSASHMFMWGTNDPNDIKQLASFAGVSARELAPHLTSLSRFEFLYVDIRDPRAVPIRSTVRR